MMTILALIKALNLKPSLSEGQNSKVLKSLDSEVRPSGFESLLSPFTSW